jgi:hypothetical protein
MASVALSRRVERVVGYPPLCDMGADQRREFHEALLEADRLRGSAGEVAGGDRRGGAEPLEAADYQQRLKNESEARMELGSAFVSVVATSSRALTEERAVGQRQSPH